MSWNKKHFLRLAGMGGLLTLAAPRMPAGACSTSGERLDGDRGDCGENAPRTFSIVPLAVTVVGAEQLASEHVYSIADLARTTPSLETVQAIRRSGRRRSKIHGISTNSFSPTAEGAVGIVVDGVPQGNVNVTNIFDMRQVEVLKGPQEPCSV